MGMLDWLRERLRADREPELLTDPPGLVVVVEAFDPAEADSAVLARSERWRPDRPAVLRPHLVLPPDQVERAAALLAQDGYELRPSGRGTDHLEAVRVQVLDALHCAQERSRMAGLAQRLGGDAPGW